NFAAFSDGSFCCQPQATRCASSAAPTTALQGTKPVMQALRMLSAVVQSSWVKFLSSGWSRSVATVEIVRCQITEQPFIHALLKQAGLRLIVWLGLIEPSFSVQPTRWVRGERWIFPLALGAVTHDAGHQLIERRDFSSEHQLECFASRTFRNSARVLAP